MVQNFIGTPVMSLQTGTELAATSQPVIDPRRLEIVAFYLEGSLLDFNPALLLAEDIREVSDIGFIINSSEELVSPEDMFSMQEILDLQFALEGMAVFDDTGSKLGKVMTYSVNSANFLVQQLYVQRPFLQNLVNTELLIHRSQIVNVTNKAITVRSTRTPIKNPVATAQEKLFYNPFRSGEPRPKPEA